MPAVIAETPSHYEQLARVRREARPLSDALTDAVELLVANMGESLHNYKYKLLSTTQLAFAGGQRWPHGQWTALASELFPDSRGLTSDEAVAYSRFLATRFKRV